MQKRKNSQPSECETESTCYLLLVSPDMTVRLFHIYFLYVMSSTRFTSVTADGLAVYNGPHTVGALCYYCKMYICSENGQCPKENSN